jgi:hypothetical protein
MENAKERLHFGKAAGMLRGVLFSVCQRKPPWLPLQPTIQLAPRIEVTIVLVIQRQPISMPSESLIIRHA